MSAWNRKNKYKAVPTIIDGVRFPSRLEGRYYSQLKIMLAHGDIKYFLRQVPLHLPGGVKYVCDFMVVMPDNEIRYIDTKGMETPVFKIKKKLVEATYPIKIEIIKK